MPQWELLVLYLDGDGGGYMNLLMDKMTQNCTNIVPMLIAYCFFFFFLGPHPRHLEVPRLGV